MPYVNVNMTKKVTPEKELAIKSALGEAIEVFPGKSEAWLMCDISDERHMYFKGDGAADCAFVEVKLFGSVNEASAEKFTAKICDMMSDIMDISPARVYVRYEGGTVWGYNGSNF